MDINNSLYEKKPFLSVIIPVYNVEMYLKECIDSILSQEYSDYEIILINDGSNDSSGEICEDYAEKYMNIYVYHTENKGVSNARNLGISKAKGSYIHFMDSDDVIDKRMYSDYYKKCSKKECDIIVSGYTSEKDNETINVNPMWDNSKFGYKKVKEYLNEITLKDKPWALNVVWNKWFKADIIKDNNISFDEKVSLGEDFIFTCEYLKYSYIVYVFEDIYYKYFIRNTGLASKFYDDVCQRRPKVYSAHKTLYETFNIYEENKDAIDKNEGHLLLTSITTINSFNCSYSKKEKIEFIKDILNLDNFSLALKYQKSKRGIIDKLVYRILRKRDSKEIYYLVSLKGLISSYKTIIKRYIIKK